MVPLYVACIVEGQGNFNAAPVLLKRLVKFVNPNVYADARPRIHSDSQTLQGVLATRGDFNAGPVLLKRLVKFVNPNVYADVRPFRVTRSKLVLLGELERAVERAGRGLRSPGVVLIVIDSDDDCPKELAPVLLDRATRAAGGRWPV